MSLKIFNTFSGEQEDFFPLMEREVRMYVCGVTVYDSSHIRTTRRKPNLTQGPSRRNRMKGKKKILGFVSIAPILLLLLSLTMVMKIHAQESSRDHSQNETGELTLRKTAQSREYQGREVEGEDKRVGPGDTLWRMLVKEKGLPEKRFSQYLVIIRGLNPQIKKIDVLRVGDSVFIPLRPDDLLGVPPVSAKADVQRSPITRGAIKEYRVKQGEHLYQILREQLGISTDREVALYYALAKDLNPERKNWDALLGGDVIRLPFPGKPAELTIAERKGPESIESKKEAAPTIDPALSLGEIKQDKSPAPANLTLDYARQLPAKENVALLGQVMESLGNEVRRDGQETLTLREGTVRVDRTSYPVVYNPKLQQRIILDPEEKIPDSLRSKLTDPSVYTAVFPVTRTSSLQESVNQLLSRLGYQSLPTDRPVVIQEAGISIEARGNWMALAPQESNKAQDIFVIALTDNPQDISDYLRKELSNRGLHFKDILLAASSGRSLAADVSKESTPPVKYWPREKREFVDAMLLSFSVPFGVSETLSIELGQGLRVDVRCDRIFERNGKRTGLFFQRLEPEIKKVLQEKEKMKVIELDLPALEHKEIMARLLSELGEQAAYREHRFAASASKDRLNITAWGFLLSKRGMFVTDREIPESLHRFFFEKGLEIVYF